MKNYLTFIFLLLSICCFSQFYDDFSDGNYTENPRWFMTDMDVQMITTNNGYAVKLHPTGEIEDELCKGSFRTANTLIDNTWWGCDLTFEVNEKSEGEIRFYISSSLPTLGTSEGFYLKINLEEKLIYFIYEDKTTSILATSKTALPLGLINLICRIEKQNNNWKIECKNQEQNIEITIPESQNITSLQSATSTGFMLIENPNNPYNLCINKANCGDKPAETEMINKDEIVITEIMAKPNPAVGLPEVEWVEIYNKTDKTLTLEGCKISSSTKTGMLNDYILAPHDYAIICSYDAMTEMIEITNKICVAESMPALNNEGSILTLKNKQNYTISFVEYTPDWYEESFKSEGGWSLERKDATNPISDATTWGASVNPRGGTPAEENSISCSLPDELLPRIIEFGIIDEKTIQFRFNKPMQGEIIELQKKITITGNSLKTASLIEPNHRNLDISLYETLDSTNTIDITFSDFACISGWAMKDTTITISFPHQTQYMDLVFNELMTYVGDYQSKYIELYNNSNFYIDLSKLMLTNKDSEGNINNIKLFCRTSTILQPQQIVILSTDTSKLNCMLGINYKSLYINTTLPSMPAKEGRIVLTDRGGTVIDEVAYSNQWHNPQLTRLQNIALERIDPMAPTQDANNWQSASSIVNYNTAGWRNSQTIDNIISDTQENFWIEETTFSPNNDGNKDQLIINYQLPESDYTATIKAYTRNGNHVTNIADNTLLSPQGYIMWDGTSKQGNIIPAGLYVITIEATHINGNRIFKKIVIIKS